MPTLRRLGGFSVLLIGVLLVSAAAVDAGVIKGNVYTTAGTLQLSQTISIEIKTFAGTSIGTANVNADGSYTCSFSTPLATNLTNNPTGCVKISFTKGGNTVNIGDNSASLSGYSVTHTIHAIVP